MTSPYGRCPRCTYKTTYAGVCRNCQYQCMLNRKNAPFVTDQMMAAYCRKASKQGTRFFCADDAYRVRYRQWKQGRNLGLLIAAGLLVVFLIAMIALGKFVEIGILFGITVAVLLSRFRIFVALLQPPPKDAFNDALITYQSYDPNLLFIDRPRLEEEAPPETPADVFNYGVERILFVDDPIVVDLLVRNGWHAEHRTLVMSQTGYPGYLKQHGVNLLRQKETLPLFLLHGPRTNAEAMSVQIRETGFPVDTHPVTDLGVSTEDLMKHPKFKKGLMGVPLETTPITMLGYGALSSAVAISMTEDVLLADLLDVYGEHYERFGSSSFG